MDRFEAMRLAVAIADAGGISTAARRLGLPLQTASRKLAALERLLGVQLFARTTRRLAPSEEGRAYLEACRRILPELESAEERASGGRGEPRGRLAVTAPIVFGRLHVLPALAAFMREYRQVDVRFVLVDGVVNLVQEGIDAAIRIGHLGDSSLVATRLATTRRVICASPAYLKQRGVPQSPPDLTAHDCVSFAGTAPGDHWRFPGRRSARAIAIRARLSVTTAEAAIDAAIAGLGLTRVLAYQAAHALARGELRLVLERFEPPPLPVSLVYPRTRFVAPRVRAFVDFMAPRLRQRLRTGP